LSHPIPDLDSLCFAPVNTLDYDVKTVTVQMPENEAKFLETYASEHDISVAELLVRYARRLQRRRAPHPENLKFTGTVPADVDAPKEYRQHVQQKHR
jgi:hypothetical protein